MLCSPTQTCFWAGRFTPAIRAMRRSPNWCAPGSRPRLNSRENPKCTCPGLLEAGAANRIDRHGECAHAPATDPGCTGHCGEPPCPAPRAPQVRVWPMIHPCAGLPPGSPICGSRSEIRRAAQYFVSPSWPGFKPVGRPGPAQPESRSGAIMPANPAACTPLSRRRRNSRSAAARATAQVRLLEQAFVLCATSGAPDLRDEVHDDQPRRSAATCHRSRTTSPAACA